MENLENKDWDLVHQSLDAQGYAVIRQVLSETECREMIDLYVFAGEKSLSPEM